MDKYEYKVKADEIKELIAEGEYRQAADIADGIDWRRVKSVMMLCTISDLYKINKRYEDAKNMLLLAYDRRPGGRAICYSLCELCIKTGDLVQALNSYKEFVQVAPRDSGRYILQYKLYVAQDVGLKERIGVLEELKKKDYREKWAYELASLYHKAQLGARCVEECDELIACFGYGRYVIKAMELKMQYQPLSPAQQETYDHRFDAYGRGGREAALAEQYEEGIPKEQEGGAPGYDPAREDGRVAEEGRGRDGYAGEEGYGGGYAGEEGYGGGGYAGEEDYGGAGYAGEEGYGGGGYAGEEDYGGAGYAGEGVYGGAGYAGEESYGGADGASGGTYGEGSYVHEDYGAEEDRGFQEGYGTEDAYIRQDHGIPEGGAAEAYSGQEEFAQDDYGRGGYARKNYEAEEYYSAGNDGQAAEDDLDIQVKTVDVGRFNTINLQAELAAGLQEVLGADNIDFVGKEQKMEPNKAPDDEKSDSYTGELEEAETDFKNIKAPETSVNEMEEIGEEEEQETESGEEDAGWQEAENEEEDPSWQEENAQEDAAWQEAESGEEDGQFRDQTAEQVMEQLRLEHTGEIPAQTADNTPQSGKILQMPKAPAVEEVPAAAPPKELAGVLSQEPDGQIGFVLPERNVLEKQITGQMKIEDILAEWERTKKANEEKCREEIRQNVLRNTGPMFTEFEEAVRDGLLEQLESSREGEAPREDIEEIAQDEVISTEEIAEFEELEEFWESDGQENGGEEAVPEAPAPEGELETKEAQKTRFRGRAAKKPEAAVPKKQDEDIPEAFEAEKAEDIVGKKESEQEEPRDSDGMAEEAEAGEEEEGGSLASEQEQEPVECEREKIRGLSREEKELYAPFVQSRRSREQLVKAIDSISMAAYTGNIVITGDEGMDTMTLAKNLIREVKMTDRNFSGKVAKITGQGLNQKNVRETLEELNNGALIIQDAAGMAQRTAAALYCALQQERTGIIVAMEDTKKAMQKLFLGTPELYGCFTARIDLEAFSNDTLVSFGRRYAREMEYSIDDLGVLALHTRIEELQTIDHVVTVIEVKKIVDEAIRHAKRKTLGHFLDVLLAKRYDDEDMIILTEKDFVA